MDLFAPLAHNLAINFIGTFCWPNKIEALLFLCISLPNGHAHSIHSLCPTALFVRSQCLGCPLPPSCHSLHGPFHGGAYLAQAAPLPLAHSFPFSPRPSGCRAAHQFSHRPTFCAAAGNRPSAAEGHGGTHCFGPAN